MSINFVKKVFQEYGPTIAAKVEQHLATNQPPSHQQIAVLARALDGNQPAYPSTSEPFNSHPVPLRFNPAKRKPLF